jgi:hypothetical protein
MAIIRKMIAEADILEDLRSGKVGLPPLTIGLVAISPEIEQNGRSQRADAFVDIRWAGRIFPFVAEIKASSTPKTFRATMDQARFYAQLTGRRPLVIVPYLPPERFKELEAGEVSGLDRCGNGMIIVPPELLVVRTGNPNRYPAARPIRNVYQGASALVPRVFLVRPNYDSVQAVQDEIAARGGRITLSTVSKVLQVLDEGLIIKREGRASSLLQPDELLQRLAANFKPPPVTERKRYRWKESASIAWPSILVRTGAASIDRYGIMPREKTLQCYCTSIAQVEQRIGSELEEAHRFPDLELIETRDPTVYFDARDGDRVAAASPVQCWLELQAGDKRQQDAARAVKERILAALSEAGWSAP